MLAAQALVTNIKFIENSNGEPPCPIQLTGIVEVAGRGGAGRGGEEQWGYVRMPDRWMDDGRNVEVQGVDTHSSLNSGS